MPAGLQAFNDFGTTQITGEQVCLSLVDEFAVTLTVRYTSGQQLYYAVNLTVPLDALMLMGDTCGVYVNVFAEPQYDGSYVQLTIKVMLLSVRSSSGRGLHLRPASIWR